MFLRKMIIVAFSLLVLPAYALGLGPEQVLVVANAKSPESVALAGLYAKRRGIEPKNIVLLETTTAYQISRKAFDTQIRKPLLQVFIQRGLIGQVRCLALIWGIPVRVGDDVLSAYSREERKSRGRLATDYVLLKSVGIKFPQPETDGLKPLGKLFAGSKPSIPKSMPRLKDLEKDIEQFFEIKQAEVVKLTDVGRKCIASRQLMALCLDIKGREGLIEYLRKTAPSTKEKLKQYEAAINEVKAKLAEVSRNPDSLESIIAARDLLDEIGGALAVGKYMKQTRSKLKPADASVDSELALLGWGNYPLRDKHPNTLHWKTAAAIAGKKMPQMLMTARIDGPTAMDAGRIIEASAKIEKVGLKGIFYIDAGGKYPPYDQHLVKLHEIVRDNTNIPVVLDEEKSLFRPETCPNAALYVGWYSLRKYVPAFTWNPGAVGWHIASFEAEHLRDPNSREWCPKMIQKGAAATVGAVHEPTLGHFPLPEEFFSLLLTGKYTIAECYWRTIPTASWRVTLIADPLYNPFKANPQLALEKLPPGLAP